MEFSITRSTGLKVDIHRVVHDKAEIACFGDVREVTVDAQRQPVARDRAANCEVQARCQRLPGIDYGGGLREMAQAVGRNVEQQVHQSGSLSRRATRRSTKLCAAKSFAPAAFAAVTAASSKLAPQLTMLTSGCRSRKRAISLSASPRR